MGRLRVTLAPDDDGTAELGAEVEADGFSGWGTAWFTIADLEAFCAGLAAYPIDPASAPSIAGGYWDDEAEQLRDIHLAIRIKPYDRSGALQVNVQLAQALAWDEPQDRRRSVSTWFKTSYNDLDRFRSSLAKVLAGQAEEAVLVSSVD